MFLHKLLLLVFSVVVLGALPKQNCHFNIPQCYFNCWGTLASARVYNGTQLHRECISKCKVFKNASLREYLKSKQVKCEVKKRCRFNRDQCYTDCQLLLTHPEVYYYRPEGSKVYLDCHAACDAFEGSQLCNL